MADAESSDPFDNGEDLLEEWADEYEQIWDPEMVWIWDPDTGEWYEEEIGEGDYEENDAYASAMHRPMRLNFQTYSRGPRRSEARLLESSYTGLVRAIETHQADIEKLAIGHSVIGRLEMPEPGVYTGILHPGLRWSEMGRMLSYAGGQVWAANDVANSAKKAHAGTITMMHGRTVKRLMHPAVYADMTVSRLRCAEFVGDDYRLGWSAGSVARRYIKWLYPERRRERVQPMNGILNDGTLYGYRYCKPGNTSMQSITMSPDATIAYCPPCRRLISMALTPAAQHLLRTTPTGGVAERLNGMGFCPICAMTSRFATRWLESVLVLASLGVTIEDDYACPEVLYLLLTRPHVLQSEPPQNSPQPHG